jgi:hypothetical protein
MLLDENQTIGDSVRGTHTYTYSGKVSPYSNQTVDVTSEMLFYPQSEDHLTVSELIAQTKPVSNASLFVSLNGFIVSLIAEPADTERLRRMLRTVFLGKHSLSLRTE